MTERQKMLAGELYDALNAELVRGRDRGRDLCQVLNATCEGDQSVRRRVLAELFGRGGDSVGHGNCGPVLRCLPLRRGSVERERALGGIVPGAFHSAAVRAMANTR